MPKLIHYRDKCIGCAVCYELQPQHWRMSKKDGKATLLHSLDKKGIYSKELAAEEVSYTKEIVKACPVRVIRLS